MVKVRMHEADAVIDAYVWTSDNKPLADALNAMLPALGPSGSDPDPDYTAAQNACETFGGEIIEADELEDAGDQVY